MNPAIEAALRKSGWHKGWGPDIADMLRAIADSPEALDMLASDPERPMNQPAAVRVAAQYYYRRLANALSSTGEEGQ